MSSECAERVVGSGLVDRTERTRRVDDYVRGVVASATGANTISAANQRDGIAIDQQIVVVISERAVRVLGFSDRECAARDILDMSSPRTDGGRNQIVQRAASFRRQNAGDNRHRTGGQRRRRVQWIRGQVSVD